MTIREDVFTLMRGLVSDRVSPMPSLIKLQTPYILYQVITENPTEQLHGNPPDMDYVRVQITCIGKTQREAALLSSDARAKFLSIASVPNLAATIEGGSDDFDSDLQLFTSDFDALIYT